jgi:tRNA-dihydrouridine synthase 1
MTTEQCTSEAPKDPVLAETPASQKNTPLETTNRNMNKLAGYEFWKKSLNSARYVVAPMVDQSELAWRVLGRRHGAHLCYTPMFHSRLFVENPSYREQQFQTNVQDRPLIVQFCGNDPKLMLKAAKYVEEKCDGVDVNLGCPQGIAKKGHYGSYLQDEWELIAEIVKTLHEGLSVPVSCKIRIFPEVEKTIRYAKMIEAAGCQLLTVHGRLREQKGHFTGLADWSQIKAVVEAVNIPVFANGNILSLEDVERCLRETGAVGVMSAETHLYNPALFSGKNVFVWDLVREYLDICKEHPTPLSFIRGHLFKLFRKCLDTFTEHRKDLGGAKSLSELVSVAEDLCDRLKASFNSLSEEEQSRDIGSLSDIYRSSSYIRADFAANIKSEETAVVPDDDALPAAKKAKQDLEIEVAQLNP